MSAPLKVSYFRSLFECYSRIMSTYTLLDHKNQAMSSNKAVLVNDELRKFSNRGYTREQLSVRKLVGNNTKVEHTKHIGKHDYASFDVKLDDSTTLKKVSNAINQNILCNKSEISRMKTRRALLNYVICIK